MRTAHTEERGNSIRAPVQTQPQECGLKKEERANGMGTQTNKTAGMLFEGPGVSMSSVRGGGQCLSEAGFNRRLCHHGFFFEQLQCSLIL
jgi:hypothetical protein